MKKTLSAIALLIILVGFFSYRVKIKDFWINLTRKKLPPAIEYQIEQKTGNTPRLGSGREEQITKNERPLLNINLKVPFTAQAPLADWNKTFKEACEEASSLMVDYYYQNKTFTPQIATEEILKMVDWQIKNFGGHFDLTATQTAQMIKEYFGYKKVEIIDSPTVQEIKSHLAANRPVIAPAAGQLLGNPYFRQPGPLYHMLVIKGYTESKFITNDPGTKRGQDYLYDFETLMSAIHDWEPADIKNGAKKIIVVYPN